MKKVLLLLAIVLALIGVLAVIFSQSADAPSTDSTQDVRDGDVSETPASSSAQIDEVEVAPLQYSIDDEDSVWLVVNKERPISLDYVPENLVQPDVTRREDKSAAELSLRSDAARALEGLFSAAEANGLFLLLGSGYRSAELQNTYYTNYVNTFGQVEADKFSARPGTSEHQTGLTADVSPATLNCYLEICFAATAEGVWVAENAHVHGFIIRYQEGKEAITGYQFEPWHLRYVGEELATELFETGQTLEEYFGLI